MPPPRRLSALLDFVRSESAGGVTLIVAAVAALIWSNSPAAPGYARLLAIGLPLGLRLDTGVNDGLMALFFLAVALEIRREMTEGELATPRRAAAPVLAAIGGMAVPAAIYAAVAWHDPAVLRGWAVPVATDIAFALAALRLLGRRAPAGLKVFLTALAIVDDLGAIVIIALFYAGPLHLWALGGAALAWLALFALGRAVRRVAPLLLGGALLWWLVLRSGVHPTIAGVALAFAVPLDAGGRSPAHRLEAALNPWVAWLVLPAFGLANAGMRVEGLGLSSFAQPAVLAALLGLLLGKPIGVFGTSAAAVRTGLAHMPAGLGWGQLLGGSLFCGIGFTMSLFIADLSFRGTALHAQAKLAVFTASLAAALLGSMVLLARRPPEPPA